MSAVTADKFVVTETAARHKHEMPEEDADPRVPDLALATGVAQKRMAAEAGILDAARSFDYAVNAVP